MHNLKLSLIAAALGAVLGSNVSSAAAATDNTYGSNAPYAVTPLGQSDETLNYTVELAQPAAMQPAAAPAPAPRAATPAPAPRSAVSAPRAVAPAPRAAAAPQPQMTTAREAQVYYQPQPQAHPGQNYTIEIAQPQGQAPAAATTTAIDNPGWNNAPTAPAPQAAPRPAAPAPQPAPRPAPAVSAYQQPQAVTAPVPNTPIRPDNSAYINEEFSGNYQNQGMVSSQPGFTFENQQTSAAGTIGVGANGTDSAAVGDPGAGMGGTPVASEVLGDQLQEVSVQVLTTFDNAVLDGFKSLESGITLGMGNSSEPSLDAVAPALRSFTTDADGNLVLRFSVPMAERILSNQGASSWKGLSNPILVWMVSLDGSEMNMVSGQSLSSFAQAILAAAPEYKYRLMFPILDLEDMQKVHASSILDHKDADLTAASRRYGADYFIAAAISSVPEESGVTLKWNLYNKEGLPVAQSAISGLMDEVASLGAGDIARALMAYQKSLKEQEQPSIIKSNNVDIDMMGPGEGFVRMRISNIRSLQDLQAIRKAFVRYGFDGDCRVVGYDNGMVVLELATNSNPINLEGTMRHAHDFTYIEPWTFSFNKNVMVRPYRTSTIEPASPTRPNSRLHPEGVTRYQVVIRDQRDVGQGAGLPNRNAPAIQGASL